MCVDLSRSVCTEISRVCERRRVCACHKNKTTLFVWLVVGRADAHAAHAHCMGTDPGPDDQTSSSDAAVDRRPESAGPLHTEPRHLHSCWQRSRVYCSPLRRTWTPSPRPIPSPRTGCQGPLKGWRGRAPNPGCPEALPQPMPRLPSSKQRHPGLSPFPRFLERLRCGCRVVEVPGMETPRAPNMNGKNDRPGRKACSKQSVQFGLARRKLRVRGR